MSVKKYLNKYLQIKKKVKKPLHILRYLEVSYFCTAVTSIESSKAKVQRLFPGRYKQIQ